MPAPYSVLLRISMALWWRYYLLFVLVAGVTAGPFLWVLRAFPELLPALERTGRGSAFVLLAALPAFRALVCYPLATQWFLKENAALLGLHAEYVGQNAAMRPAPSRRVFPQSWALFWMVFLWEMANAVALRLLVSDWMAWRSLLAAFAIHANVAFVTLLAILPMNINWALQNRFLGAQWRFSESPEST